MASTQIEKLVSLYRTVVQYPNLVSAKIMSTANNVLKIQSLWSQRNLERKTNQKFLKSHLLTSDFDHTISESFPIDVTTELLSAVTEDLQRKAVLRTVVIENVSKQFIEIWDQYSIIKNYDLSALDIHGDVYADAEFGSFEWSPSGTKLLYIAEKKQPKSEPFYKQKSADKKEKEKKDDNETVIGNEYVYKPEWGEQLVGKSHPVVAVLDTETDKISVIPGIPDDLSPGQVVWAKDESEIIGVAWKHEPRHLGLVFCTNRDSWIFALRDGKFNKLSRDKCAVRCPRISPNGIYLIWLERESGGPHHNGHRLMKLNLNKITEPEIIIDSVETAIKINHGKQFTGLYGRLPKYCWCNESRYIFWSTQQKSNVRSYFIDTTVNLITEIENDESSLGILDVKDNNILFLQSCLTTPSVLFVAKFSREKGVFARKAVTPIETIPNSDKLMYESTEYTYENDDEVNNFNFTYFGVKNGEEKSVPLIVTAHGGPHSNYCNLFDMEAALFTMLGFAVVQVNYRGSTGMGYKNVEYLMGKVGEADVKDCMTASKEALKKYPWLNPEKIAICGGSHGGFLVTHLSAQYPLFYKAVVARNPVIDIAAMATISDIPDWCSAVAKSTYPELHDGKLIDYTEIVVKMFNCSPIYHVDAVKAPTLICIGTVDLRVPPSQGKLWYHRLKANNVTTKMLVYEDNHPLASSVAEIDRIINECLWLIEHLSH
ncbi:acylamino-acid-releasing enzyme-like [Prorops nasuta]|uniref:acylamino-acid-releasing enzyme-like n=1 Tax=Prorops nasuta TaxID=863751 RepID=UPI0034CF4EAF